MKAESSKLYWVGAALLFISFLFVLMSLDFFNLRIVNDVPLALATGAAVLQGLWLKVVRNERLYIIIV